MIGFPCCSDETLTIYDCYDQPLEWIDGKKFCWWSGEYCYQCQITINTIANATSEENLVKFLLDDDENIRILAEKRLDELEHKYV